jgi:hypothetical protein
LTRFVDVSLIVGMQWLLGLHPAQRRFEEGAHGGQPEVGNAEELAMGHGRTAVNAVRRTESKD